MEKNRTGHRRPVFLIRLAACGLAVVLCAGIVEGLQLWSPGGRGWLALLPATVLAVTMAVGIRARRTKRWRAALDAYAEREMARDGGREAA
jgi:hypothetical protein